MYYSVYTDMAEKKHSRSDGRNLDSQQLSCLICEVQITNIDLTVLF